MSKTNIKFFINVSFRVFFVGITNYCFIGRCQETISFSFFILGIWFGALMNGSLDTLIAGLMTHAGGQLEVLKHSLRHVRERAQERLQIKDDLCKCNDKYTCNKEIHLQKNSKELDEELYNEIMRCIAHHQAITE